MGRWRRHGLPSLGLASVLVSGRVCLIAPSCVFEKLRHCCILTWTSFALACGPSVVTEAWGFFFFTSHFLWSRCISHFSGPKHLTSLSYHVSLIYAQPLMQCTLIVQLSWVKFGQCTRVLPFESKALLLTRMLELLSSNKSWNIASLLKRLLYSQ